MENWDLFYPIKIARRYQNSKRSYLLVNCLQAKHIPVRPRQAFHLYQALGNQIKSHYPKARLVIGFAETATAIGFGVAKAMGDSCWYLTTTREEYIAEKDCICFYEEHSHATEQKLYIREIEHLLEQTEEVVFIDDEISTGKTLFNILSMLKDCFSEWNRHKIVVGSILNRLTPERERFFQEHQIFFESLFRFSCEDTMLQRTSTALSAPSSLFFKTENLDMNAMPEILRLAFADARKPISVSSYQKNCDLLATAVLNSISMKFHPGQNILVLGTEECMYPSIDIAEKLEQLYQVNTYCHATTRSPICIGSDTTYPVRNGYQILSFYQKDRINYIYNLQHYDAAILISDTQASAETAVIALDAILKSYQIPRRFYILGGA